MWRISQWAHLCICLPHRNYLAYCRDQDRMKFHFSRAPGLLFAHNTKMAAPRE